MQVMLQQQREREICQRWIRQCSIYVHSNTTIFCFLKKRYRQAIDAAWDNVTRERNIKERMAPRRIISAPDEHVSRLDLTHVFARGQDENNDGLTPGFFEGPKHQR